MSASPISSVSTNSTSAAEAYLEQLQQQQIAQDQLRTEQQQQLTQNKSPQAPAAAQSIQPDSMTLSPRAQAAIGEVEHSGGHHGGHHRETQEASPVS